MVEYWGRALVWKGEEGRQVGGRQPGSIIARAEGIGGGKVRGA